MKKFLAITLALTLVLALTACGNLNYSDSNTSDTNTTQQDEDNSADVSSESETPSSEESSEEMTSSDDETTARDTSTPEGILACVGLTLEDVQPSGDVSFITSTAKPNNATYKVQFWFDNEDNTRDATAFLTNACAALKKISADGKIYNADGVESDFSEEINRIVVESYEQGSLYIILPVSGGDLNAYCLVGADYDPNDNSDDAQRIPMYSISFQGRSVAWE